jgi:hypothetical protein
MLYSFQTLFVTNLVKGAKPEKPNNQRRSEIMKKYALLLVGVVIVAFAFNTARATYPQVTGSPVMMIEKAILGPDPTNANYAAWASNIVWSIYNTGKVPGETNGTVLGYRLDPSYVVQNPVTFENTNVLWFTIHIKAINPSYMFTPSNLVFKEYSSDLPNNLLGKYKAFTNSTYIYSPWALGVIWGPNGPRTSDNILQNASSGSWASPANEFIFIGVQSKYFTYTNAATMTVDTNYMNSFTAGIGFSVNGQYMLMGSNGDGGMTSVGLSQVTLQMKGAPLTPVQVVQRGVPSGAQYVTVGVNMETNRTVLVQFRPELNRGSWEDICTMNANEVINWNMLMPGAGTNLFGFFRYGLEE